MDPFPKDGESAAVGEPSRGAAPSSGVVVQVREKKGPLRAAIPYMPFPVAVICLFLNTFVPGLGVWKAVPDEGCDVEKNRESSPEGEEYIHRDLVRRPKNWNLLRERKGVKGFEDGSNLDEESAFDA
ncbi:protein stum [Grus japonensis]|uniref:Protein stum n=1 Tax=Grus japonensis TaxID=30415 RepID=A0ABC9WRS3_GRUJA